MSPRQELINKIFSKCPVTLDIAQSDIVEFMLLEYYECFSYLQDKEHIFYRVAPIHDGFFTMGKLTGNYRVSIALPMPVEFIPDLSLTLVQDRIRTKERAKGNNINYSTQGFIVENEITRDMVKVDLSNNTIEDAILASSLAKAAGDLANLSLKELLTCQDTLNQYPTQENTVNQLVAFLKTRLEDAIAKLGASDASINQQQAEFQQKKQNTLLIVGFERNFLTEYRKLQSKLNALIDKGTSEFIHKSHPFSDFLMGFSMDYSMYNDGDKTPNTRYNPNYQAIKETAKQLDLDLNNAYETYLSDNDLAAFKQSCNAAIDTAKPEFSKHRANNYVKVLLLILGKLQSLFNINQKQRAQTPKNQGFFSIQIPTKSLSELCLFEDEINNSIPAITSLVN